MLEASTGPSWKEPGAIADAGGTHSQEEDARTCAGRLRPAQVLLWTPRFARGSPADKRAGGPRPASLLLALGAIGGFRSQPALPHLLQGADQPAGLAAGNLPQGLAEQPLREPCELLGIHADPARQLAGILQLPGRRPGANPTVASARQFSLGVAVAVPVAVGTRMPVATRMPVGTRMPVARRSPVGRVGSCGGPFAARPGLAVGGLVPGQLFLDRLGTLDVHLADLVKACGSFWISPLSRSISTWQIAPTLL